MLTAANALREHEYIIIDKIFEKGKISGITDNQLKHFVDSRLNLCLQNLGLEPKYEVIYDPISLWFYDGIINYKMNDFFSGAGSEYTRNWSEDSFVW